MVRIINTQEMDGLQKPQRDKEKLHLPLFHDCPPAIKRGKWKYLQMEVSSWEHIYTWRIFQQTMSDFQRVSSPLVPVPGLKEIFGLDLGNSLFRHTLQWCSMPSFWRIIFVQHCLMQGIWVDHILSSWLSHPLPGKQVWNHPGPWWF